MKPLVPHELDQIQQETYEFLQNLALVGMRGIVIFDGRGAFQVCYGKETAPDAQTLLADSYHSVKDHNARKRN